LHPQTILANLVPPRLANNGGLYPDFAKLWQGAPSPARRRISTARTNWGGAI